MLLTLSRIPPRPGKRLHSTHILGMLDEWGHKVHLPGLAQGPLCEAWDWYLGVYDDDDVRENDVTGAES